MKESEVLVEVSRLVAAFPSSKADAHTVNEYCRALGALRYPSALTDAVNHLLATERWLPSIAQVREEYTRHVDKHMPRQIEAAPPSEDDQQRNHERAAAMTRHLAAAGTGGHGDTVEACQHPDCVALKGTTP